MAIDRFKLMVCPHDTVKEPERWYELVRFCEECLGIGSQFELSLDFEDFHAAMGSADILYANPADTLHLHEQHGFAPLVRAQGKYDEVVLVANTDISHPTPAMLNGETLLSVCALLPTRIALAMLNEQGVAVAGFQNRDSWLGVISALWRGEGRFGVVYKDTYDELSAQGKGMVTAFATSDQRVAFHSICISPRLQARQQEIAQCFLDMANSPEGQRVLTALHISGWLPVSAAELDAMQQVHALALP